MAMTMCSLGGYQYPYNPPKNPNPLVKAVSATDTLEGRVYTIFNMNPSRQSIEQKWPVLDADFFEALQAKSILPGALPYIHDDGVAYTVIVMPPTFDNKTPGGDAYENVTLLLHVVSSP